MIKEAKIEIILNSKNIKHYEDLGYEIPRYKDSKGRLSVKRGTKIIVNPMDAPSYSKEPITAICEKCGSENKISIQAYNKNIKNQNIYTCDKCKKYKYNNTCFDKYGVSSACSLESVKNKSKQTCLHRYGYEIPLQNNEIKEKSKQTCIVKYGVDHASKAKEVKEKTKNTCIEKYGCDSYTGTDEFKQKVKSYYMKNYGVVHNMQVPHIKEKARKSMEEHQTCATSKAQNHLYELYGGILNYSFKYYNFDIYLPDDKIDIEYDGGGHNLSIVFGDCTEKEFKRKEIIRDHVVSKNKIKILRIVSVKDNIPSDEIFMDMLEISRNFFNTTNHSWITWYIDENKYCNSECKEGTFYDFGKVKRIR